MTVEYAEITGRITLPNSDIGAQVRIEAIPMTDDTVISIPFDRTLIGIPKATTDEDGYLPTSGDQMLRLPLPPDLAEPLAWRFIGYLLGDETSLTGQNRDKIDLGTYQISESGTLEALVETEVIAVTPTLVANFNAMLTAAEEARTGAETARTGAETARTGAEAARDAANAAILADLNTTDGQSSTLLNNKLSATAAAARAIADFARSPILSALKQAAVFNGQSKVTSVFTSWQQPITNTGTERWNGQVESLNGKRYFVPRDATKVLIFDPVLGTAVQTDFGLTLTDASKWSGGARGRNGKIYCAPYNSPDVLVIDPATGTATRETFGLTLSATAKYSGAVLGANGLIYCIPYSAAGGVLVIDPDAGSAHFNTFGITGANLTGGVKWSGGVSVGTKIYGIPFSNTGGMLVIDTIAGTAAVNAFGASMTGNSKWSSGAVIGTKIYCAPRDATDMLVVDTTAGTATRETYGATLTGTGKWRQTLVIGTKVYGIPGDSADFLVLDTVAGTATRETYGTYEFRQPLNMMPGGLKWAGAFALKGKIYGVPCGGVQAGQDMLVLDTTTTPTPTGYYTDLRAYIPTTTTKWFGGVLHPNGKIYCAPASAQDLLVIDTTTQTAIRRTYAGVTLDATPQKYAGGCLGGDGKIYFVPRSTEATVLVVDPATETAIQTDFGLPLGTGAVEEQKWIGASVGLNGKIYCIPFLGDKVMVIDPATSTAELTNFGLDLTDADKSVGAQLHPNGKIYCAPRGAPDVLVIDTNLPTATAIRTNFGLNLATGSGGLNGMKYAMPKLGMDGKIYCLPRTAPNFLVIDPATDTAAFKDFGLDMSAHTALTGSGYTISGAVGADGKIYCAAVESATPKSGLIVDVLKQTATYTDFGLGATITYSDEFADAVRGAGRADLLHPPFCWRRYRDAASQRPPACR